MKPFTLLRNGLTAICVVLAASTANAELQTWRLTGVVDPDSGTPGAGGIASEGSVHVDYVFDLDAPYDATFGEFVDLVRSVSLNDGPALAPSQSQLFLSPGAAFLGVGFASGQVGGLSAVYFGHADDLSPAGGLSGALARLSAQVRNRDELTLFFAGNQVAYVIPSSFTMLSAVPEPGGAALVWGGLGVLALLGRVSVRGPLASRNAAAKRRT